MPEANRGVGGWRSEYPRLLASGTAPPNKAKRSSAENPVTSSLPNISAVSGATVPCVRGSNNPPCSI